MNNKEEVIKRAKKKTEETQKHFQSLSDEKLAELVSKCFSVTEIENISYFKELIERNQNRNK